jgi:hypothetical protein
MLNICSMGKCCPGCGETRDDAAFNFKNRSKGRRQVYCRDCSRRYVRDHYARNKDYYLRKARARNRMQRLRLLDRILDYLNTHPCVDCGERDPVVLDFDHIDPATKRWEIAVKVRYGSSWRIIEAEIAKCDVRCANDHRRRTARQFGWYRLVGQIQ